MSEKRKQHDDFDDYDAPPRKRRGLFRRIRAGWSMGVFGCSMLPLVVLAVLILTGVNTFGGVLSSVRSIFDPGEPVYTVTPSTTILEGVVALSELTTTQYNFSNIITSGRELPSLLRGLYRDNLTLVAVGQIEAGIDLRQMTEADIMIEDGVLMLRLPEPRLQRCFINEGASVVVDRSTGFFASPAPDLDARARGFAINIFREQALQQGILTDANTQAQQVLETFLSLFPFEGVDSVQILTTPPDTVNPVLPATCVVDLD